MLLMKRKQITTPTRDCEIFVSKIPTIVTEQELVSMFEKYGDIYTLRLIPNFSKEGKSYAFVRFTEKIAVRDAILFWNGYEIRKGFRISVCKSVESRSLVLVGVPKYLSSNDIYFLVNVYTDGLQGVYAHAARGIINGFNSGIAILTYANHTTAREAKKMLINVRNWLWNHPVYVLWNVPGLECADYMYSRRTEVVTTPTTIRVHICECGCEATLGYICTRVRSWDPVIMTEQ